MEHVSRSASRTLLHRVNANLFRIAIVEFLDPHNFCLSRVKRSCVHFVTAEGKIVPFDTYNLFYRDAEARARREASLAARLVQLGG